MQFDKIDKKSWLDKLLLDFKAKDASSLAWKMGKNTSFPAMFHEDDAIASGTLHNANGDPVFIAQEFLITDEKINNEQILKALTHGVNAPRFIFKNETYDFSSLFEGIHLEMVSPSYDFQSLACAKTFIQYLENTYDESHMLNGSVWSEAIPSAQVHALFKNHTFTYRCFQLAEASTDLDAIPNMLEDLCNQLVNHLSTENNSKDAELKFAIRVGIGHSFLIEIAKLRAIRILFANVFKAFNLSVETPVELHVHFHTYREEMISSDRMIAASTQSICAFLGNADRINVQAASSEAFQKHVARNVMHVLQQESHLDFVKDPTAGSYYIEELTNQLCDKTWKLLQKK